MSAGGSNPRLILQYIKLPQKKYLHRFLPIAKQTGTYLGKEVFFEPSNSNEIEDYATVLTKSIQSPAWYSTPLIQNKESRPSFTISIKCMIAEKLKLRKWQRSRDAVLKTNLNNLTKMLSLNIKEFENKAFNLQLSGLSNEKSSDYSLWKALKKSNVLFNHLLYK